VSGHRAATLEQLRSEAEQRWLDLFTAGPSEAEGTGLRSGTRAPELELPDHTGRLRNLAEFWSHGPALIMFWRHFGCGCGVERAARLRAEYDGYREVGLNPVIVSQGEPARAAAYHDEHGLPCAVLCDPDLMAYKAYGLGHWSVERVLFDAPAEFWAHPREIGQAFQDQRRETGRAPVDDPWRATAEYVVGASGAVQLCHLYQHCEDFPHPQVLTTAARLSR
jgi:peroxiredoxin